VTVFEAVEAELKDLGEKAQDTALAAAALALAAEVDGGNSLTSKTLAVKEIRETLRELRALVPPKPEEDEIERARRRRADRLAGTAAAGSAAPS
jgi:hypothetical protein